jgi:hypothetical protein
LAVFDSFRVKKQPRLFVVVDHSLIGAAIAVLPLSGNGMPFSRAIRFVGTVAGFGYNAHYFASPRMFGTTTTFLLLSINATIAIY